MLSNYGYDRKSNKEFKRTTGIVLMVGVGKWWNNKEYVNVNWTYKDGTMRECQFERKDLTQAISEGVASSLSDLLELASIIGRHNEEPL
tara:strand:+ start:39 stop:305 length:267 start_codon:yes stop_codon:yes gene_type:complete